MRNREHTLILSCLLVSALAAAAMAADPAPIAVFAPAQAAPAGAPQLAAQDVIRSRLVSVRTDALRRVETGQRLALDPFADLPLAGLVERAEHRGPGHVSIAGSIDGHPGGRFNLSVVDEAMAARIFIPDGNVLVDLVHRGNGVHLVRQRDPALMEPCGGGVSPAADEAAAAAPDPDEDSQRLLRQILRGAAAATGTCSEQYPYVLDTLIVYTAAARLENGGGSSGIRAQCYLGIDLANQAYADSGIDLYIRAVMCDEISYTESGSLETDLDRLEQESDGYMDVVHAWRDDHYADNVVLIISESTPSAGLGECVVGGPGRAFAVLEWDNIPGQALAHEVGHNLGCAHDRENVDCSGAYSYSYGWRFTGSSGTQWRTVMAYTPGTLIDYFSNPDVSYDGQPTGVPIGDANESDNAETIQSRRDIMPGFYTTHFEAWVDFDHTGTESGTFDEPFTTIFDATSFLINGTHPSEPPSLWIKAGSTTDTTILAEPLLLRSCGGTVVIGGS